MIDFKESNIVFRDERASGSIFKTKIPFFTGARVSVYIESSLEYNFTAYNDAGFLSIWLNKSISNNTIEIICDLPITKLSPPEKYYTDLTINRWFDGLSFCLQSAAVRKERKLGINFSKTNLGEPVDTTPKLVSIFKTFLDIIDRVKRVFLWDHTLSGDLRKPSWMLNKRESGEQTTSGETHIQLEWSPTLDYKSDTPLTYDERTGLTRIAENHYSPLKSLSIDGANRTLMIELYKYGYDPRYESPLKALIMPPIPPVGAIVCFGGKVFRVTSVTQSTSTALITAQTSSPASINYPAPLGIQNYSLSFRYDRGLLTFDQ